MTLQTNVKRSRRPTLPPLNVPANTPLPSNLAPVLGEMVYVQITGGKIVYAVTERILRTQRDAQVYLREFGVTPDTCPPQRRVFSHDEFTFNMSHTLEEIFGDEPIKHSQLVDDMLPKLKAQKLMSVTTSHERNAASQVSSSSTKAAPDRTHYPSIAAALKANPTAVVDPSAVSFKASVVPLKEICQKLGMEPRVARSKLRKALPGNSKQRWEWSADEARNIMKVLTS
jgi:hypothetical protein